jgi:hypothetical protein
MEGLLGVEREVVVDRIDLEADDRAYSPSSPGRCP